MRSRVFLAILPALVVAACGDDAVVVPTEVADDLAGRAEAIAALAEQDEGCGALDQIAVLRDEIGSARGDTVPVALADELLAAVGDLEGQIACEPPPPPDDEQDDEEEKEKDDEKDEEKDEGDDEEHEGRGNGPPPGRGKDD